MQGKRERLGPGLLKVSLRADQTLKALSYVSATLPVIAGFSLIAINARRAKILLNSSQRQSVDTMALAMADELDHTNDANNAPDPVMASDIAGSIPAITAGLRSVTHGSRLLNGLVNVTEVNIPVFATSTVTSEDLNATWISS